ncbi:AB-hydrolase YheT [Metschnikowia bicuspidata var. bicuspidata NRRL YB-4993]|uniref:AB-hydrolase YheT n=1 Tax=Metschnikowia bicuspidata var. bicuspidata NRRL YB-4993 TaxID=869754 RepID=A0A1A0HAH9_9ASCO|nr:AB-hydrolase YheT [Metschnikowia bicuspidata var. bicuspidata NRRL YB-4993]OBA20883.1 AB-hydrolase YheT [Metschnikowia bicuspidata var. bicuspidata NRRL YB-4993]
MSGFFKSKVSSVGPKQPATYHKGQTTKTLEEIIAGVAPELSPGYSFYVNPLLSSGHSQTAYTALNKFENIDKVHYKRMVYQVESDKRFYEVKGDKMPYDRWEGQSTIAVDYVVGDEACDAGHEQFRPASQKYELPPRTEFMNPAHEQALLDNEKPLVVALHGLAGGSFESYLRAFMVRVTGGHGFDGLVLNARGCANHTITSPQLFCGLWTNDLRYLINEHIRRKWPQKKIFLIGFSLGGAIIANYLGQEGPDAYENLKGAAVMGSPWDFPQASAALVDNFLGSKIYSPKMCQNLLRLLDQHYDDSLHLEDIIAKYKREPEAFRLQNLRDFDDAFTSQLFGFNSAQEYYRHASPDQRLLNVRVPTLIVSSADDPIVGGKTVPVSEVSLNPYTHMVVTSVGGHLGWFDIRFNRWYAEPLARVFEEWSTWDVERIPEEALPRATHGSWRHDRIVL